MLRVQRSNKLLLISPFCKKRSAAAIAQLGERQTEDLKVPGSIPGLGKTVKVGQESRHSSSTEDCWKKCFYTGQN